MPTLQGDFQWRNIGSRPDQGGAGQFAFGLKFHADGIYCPYGTWLKTVTFLTVTQLLFAACTVYSEAGQLCDMTPDGSLWLTVVRLVWAEEKYHNEHHTYGKLVEMTNLLDGLPPALTSGQMGSYTITINLTDAGFVLHANPDRPHGNRRLLAFYGDQTGLITFERSGKPAGPKSEKMSGSPTYYTSRGQ